MVVKKERVFEIFDKLIDENATQGESLHHYISSKMPTLRKRCIRNFGSVKAALTEYGFDYDTEKELPFPKLYDFVEDCFIVSEYGHIVVDFATLLIKTNELIALGYKSDGSQIIKQVEEFLELERVESFMRYYNESASEILDKRKQRYPENQMATLVEKHYGFRKDLYRTYCVSQNMISTANFLRVKSLIVLGREFENLVYEVLSEINSEVNRHYVFDGCLPDFVIGDNWYDAKLSRSTALNESCETLNKYSKYTDHLTIIYAIHDTESDDSRASFVHITEYYPYISAELQREIDAFIRKASEVKFGESHRL